MKTKLLATILAGLLSANTTPAYHITEVHSEVDRIEDNNMAVTMVYVENSYGVYEEYQFDIPNNNEGDYENGYNIPKQDGEDIDVTASLGYITNTFNGYNYKGEKERLYQFKSIDDEVWWLLTEEELDFIPRKGTPYILVWYDNGTGKYNKPCDCLEEWDCECHLYDDIYLGLYEYYVYGTAPQQ